MSKLPSWRAWLIWALAALFFFLEYFARVAPSVMVEPLMAHYRVGAFQLGSLSAFFYYAYVGMQLPVGTMMDRLGPRYLLSAMGLLCALSCFLFARSQVLWQADVLRFLMGFSAAFAFVGALKLARVWFDLRYLGLLAGLTQAVGMLGAAVGEGPLALMVARWGWQATMDVIAAALLVLAFVIFAVVRDAPKVVAGRRVQVSHCGMWQGLLQVLRNPQTWANGVYVGCIYAPTAAFAELWGATYMHTVHHMTPDKSAMAISMIFIGLAVGCPLLGWLSDRLQSRRMMMFYSALFSFVTLTVVLYGLHGSAVALFVVLFLYGISNAGVSLAYAVAGEMNGKNLAGTSMSFANMASVLIGALFQPLIGGLLVAHWSGAYNLQGVAMYSPEDYRFAMAILPVCLLFSLLSLCWLKESYQRQTLTAE